MDVAVSEALESDAIDELPQQFEEFHHLNKRKNRVKIMVQMIECSYRGRDITTDPKA